MVLSEKKTLISCLRDNSLYKNRTYHYLVPSLAYYGPQFKTKLLNLRLHAFAIGDNDLKDLSVLQNRKCIYIMFNYHINRSHTTNVINWFKNQDYFVDCVPYVDTDKPYWLLIIDYPEPLLGAYEKFLLGKYSQMYSKEELKLYFDSSKHKEALSVINKTAEAGLIHISRVKEDFDTTLTFKDLSANGYQYDYPPRKEEEVFNY